MDLDDEQRAAVLHGDGPVLVLAGAGAGKTRVLTGRVVELMYRGVDPARICVCTFTRKASAEMADRLGKMVPIGDDIFIGTIHSLCWRLYRKHCKEHGVVPPSVDEYRSGRIVEQLMEPPSNYTIGMSLAQWFRGAYNVGSIDLVKSMFAAAQEFLIWDEENDAVFSLTDIPQRIARDAYISWQQEKAKQGIIDFNDMALLLWHWWENHPIDKERDRALFDHVLVDEFQDTSHSQWAIIRHIAPRNIFAVGDDFQGIYGFRFADVGIMLNLEEEYPGVSVYHINTNYRSTEEIVSSSLAMIRHNPRQLDKELRAYRNDHAEIEVWEPADPLAEADAICNDIIKHDSQRCAVLYRTNAYAAAVELKCLEAGIQYRMAGGAGFLSMANVQDMIAYLELSRYPDRWSAFVRAISRPMRYIGKKTTEQVRGSADLASALLHANMNRNQATNAAVFNSLIGVLRKMTDTRDAINLILSDTQYQQWASSHHTYNSDLMSMLLNIAGNYTIDDFLAFVSKMRGESEDGDEPVTLSTVHRSKGLEWPTVYVAGFCAGIMPHYRCQKPEEVEEERRVAYVAMTRARDRLVLCVPSIVAVSASKVVGGPSSFLAEALQGASALLRTI